MRAVCSTTPETCPRLMVSTRPFYSIGTSVCERTISYPIAVRSMRSDEQGPQRSVHSLQTVELVDRTLAHDRQRPESSARRARRYRQFMRATSRHRASAESRRHERIGQLAPDSQGVVPERALRLCRRYSIGHQYHVQPRPQRPTHTVDAARGRR